MSWQIHVHVHHHTQLQNMSRCTPLQTHILVHVLETDAIKPTDQSH